MPLDYVLMLADVASAEEMCAALRQCPEGNVVEVGVYQGGSAMRLYEVCEQQNRKLYLYDTFTGIPFKSGFDSHNVGDFADTDARKVSALMPKALVMQGVFPFTVVKMDPIAFAHIDADQYNSIKMALYVLGPMMAKGGLMWFDDVGCLEGATKAFNDYRNEWKKTAFQAKCGKYYMEF